MGRYALGLDLSLQHRLLAPHRLLGWFRVSPNQPLWPFGHWIGRWNAAHFIWKTAKWPDLSKSKRKLH
jgi:hypothetical protein